MRDVTTDGSPWDPKAPAPVPGDRPARPSLERPPGERYLRAAPDPTASDRRADALAVPLALILGTAIAFTILGGILTVTAGLVIVAIFLGWLTGRLVSPPGRAALVALVAVVVGLLGIWLFGRMEGGVLDPVTYLLEVEGPVVVGLCLVGGAGLAAAASRAPDRR